MSIEGDFEVLVNRYMDGQATAEEVQRLNERLRSDAEARNSFAELLNLDSTLGALLAEGRSTAIRARCASTRDGASRCDNVAA